MTEDEAYSQQNRWFFEGLISAVSAGFFFVLVGVIFVINQGLVGGISDFGKDFVLVRVANTNTSFPVPATPAAHTVVYTAAFQFALGIAILQVAILAARLLTGSRRRRIAQTVGSLVFWSGSAYLLTTLVDMKSTLAISQQLTVWYEFWAAIIVVFGISIVIRSVAFFFVTRKG